MATVRDIAKLAGVSIGTVSKALNDQPRMSAATRQHIKQIAEELGYFPNRLAHAVLTKQSRAIGLILPDIQRPYDACLVSGVLAEALKTDYHVIVREFHYQADLLNRALTLLIEHRVEGIICAPVYQAPVLLDALTTLRGQGIAIVSIDMHTQRDLVNTVCNDREQLGEIAVEYLVGLGHRQIAMVGGMPNVPFNVTLGSAVLQALRKRHLVPLHYGNIPTELYDESYVTTMLQSIQSTRPTPTALICWTDITAAWVAQCARTLKLRIPEDYSILACNDSLILKYYSPTISCVDIDPAEKGRTAVRVLLQNIEQKLTPPPPERLTVPCRLVARNSCRKPAAAW